MYKKVKFLHHTEKLILKILKIIILGYSYFLSPFLPKSCRYYPSCSEYFLQSIERFGKKGILFGIFRILRCNPFFLGGYDPVASVYKPSSKTQYDRK